MVLIPACESGPFDSSVSLPPVVGTQSPRAPIPGVWPAEPQRGPFVLCESDNGQHSQTSSHGSGPGKGPQQLHTEASVQQPLPQGPPPTFPGCHHLQGTAPGAGWGQAAPKQTIGAP